ncbi:hypothetical protein ACFFRR_000713 [Megaselia abdita]
MLLNNKVAIITGGSSGIGAGTALLFAKHGAAICIIGRNLENLNSIEQQIKSETEISDDKILLLQLDVSVIENLECIIKKTIEKFGRIDVLVNNAGVLETGTIENTSLEQFDRVMNVNIRSIYHLTMLATPYLIKTKGNIINISSVNGMRSFPGVLAYNVSKAAVDQFTRCVALELAGKGVRCNSINPGVIVTNIHKRGGMNEETYAKFLEHSKTTHALRRAGTVDEVASCILFLATDQSSFITGINLPVDGGRNVLVNRTNEDF